MLIPMSGWCRNLMENGQRKSMPDILLDLEPLWMARVDDYLANAVGLTVADLSNRKTHEATA